MKLQKDSSININKPLISNNVIQLYPKKLNNFKEMKSINSSVETNKNLGAKSAFSAENSNILIHKIDKIKSSIFKKINVKLSKDKTNNNTTQNITKSIDEKSDYYTKKNERPNEDKEKTEKHNQLIGNFSSSFSSKTNFPEVKSTSRNSILSSSNNSKFALTFFKVPNKKSSISLKKDANCERVNDINYLSNEKININSPFKYPKKPTTMDYGNCFISNRSNLNTANNLQKINQTNFADKMSIKSNIIKKEEDVHYNANNNCIMTSENQSSNYKAKVNEKLSSFLINKRNHENEARIIANPKTPNNGFNSNVLNKNKNNFPINKSLVNKITPPGQDNSYSPVKQSKNNSENFYCDALNKNNNLNRNSSIVNLYAKNIENSSSQVTQEVILIENKTTCSDFENPNNIGTSKNFNNLQLIPINTNKSLNCVNLTKNNHSNTQITLSNYQGNNYKLNSSSSYYSPTKVGLVKRSFSPNSDNNFIGNLKKLGSLQNFFKSENILNNENNLDKSESRLSKLTSLSNSKMVLLRPRTVNGIDCIFNAKLSHDMYRSVQDVLDMPTSYLPFSKKRDKNSELERQSFFFQNKVERELKEAKKRDSRKIKIKSKNELSNYLMRDYFIGGNGDTITSSKKRMRITKDFERDKEIQKKKKMAFLKNEDYKETEKEDLSDSDGNSLFETMNEEEKDKDKTNLTNWSRNKKTKDLDNPIKGDENMDDNEISVLDENNDIMNYNAANSNTDKNIKSSQGENDDYFKQEDSKKNDPNLLEDSKKTIDSQSDLENSVQSKAFEKEELTKENIKRQSFALTANNLNLNKKISMLNKNNTRNIKSIDENKSLKFRSTIGSFDNKINKNNKRASSKFSILKSVKNYESNAIKLNNQVKEEDKIVLKKELSKINSTNKLSLVNNLPLDKLQDLIKAKKKKLEDKMFDDIKIRSEAKADQILDISLDDYSEIELENSDRLSSNNVNLANLNRVIRVRNILKGRHKDDEQKRQYQGLNEETDDEILKILRFQKLGPPSFLRTNFKKETEIKFKMLGGKFFGCKV